jgi:hypothetical protein
MAQQYDFATSSLVAHPKVLDLKKNRVSTKNSI